MSNKFVDYVDGNNANTAADFAQRRQQVSGTSVSAGDVIRVAKSPDPTNAGIDATFTYQSIAITLDSALTTTVDLCESAWSSDDGDVTCDVSSTRKQGSQSCSFAVAGSFGTGLAAHKDLGGAIDVSSREQLSFLIRSDVQIAANSLALNLCSDTAGAVTVDAFTIPYQINTNSWHFITVDKGSALGSTINSIALEVLIDLGGSTVTILLDDIVACNASDAEDCLTLNTLVATASSGPYYGLKSISGTSIVIDQDTNSGVGVGRGFTGTTATTSLWVRQPILYPLTSSDSITTSASATAPITISGGWDAADSMTTQNGETWVDLIGGVYNGLSLAGTLYNWAEKISFVRGDVPIALNGYYNKITDVTSSHFKQNAIAQDINASLSQLIRCNLMCSTGVGIPPRQNTNTVDCNIVSNSSDGLTDSSGNMYKCTFVNTDFRNNGGRPINMDQSAGNDCLFSACDFTGCGTASPQLHRNSGLNFYGCSFDEQITVATAGSPGNSGYYNSGWLFKSCTIDGYSEMITSPYKDYTYGHTMRVTDLNGVEGNNYLYDFNSYVSPGSDPDKWDIEIIGDGNLERGEFWKFPFDIPLPYLEADKATTVTVQIKRSSANVSSRAVIYGGSLEGINSTIISETTASSVGAYETLTLDSFTPTKAGTLRLFIESWPTATGTFHVYLKEVTVMQV